jgi:hypothetical protein
VDFQEDLEYMAPVSLKPEFNINIIRHGGVTKEYKMSEVKLEKGIEETKDVVKFGVSLANAVIKSLEDGKISIGDALNFISPATKTPAAFSGIDKVPAELADLTAEEQQELIITVQSELEVTDEKAKAIVTESLKTIVQLYNLVAVIKG